MWWLVYGVLLATLVVRFRAPAPARGVAVAPTADEPVRLVALHHGVFAFLLLVAVPLEALVVGGAARGRVAGALLFASGVVLYRWSVAALGDALSPFVLPHPGSRLVTAGPYRYVRHPLYAGQLGIAFGAPLTLGCRWALAASAGAALVVALRIAAEDAALARVYPEWRAYAARAKRLVPFVF
jgi:protein-S-isoprenylcysteine O-methyltransferase Ste14